MLSVAELKRWKAVCFNGLHNGCDMYANEMSFLTDMDAKFEKHGQQSYVSEKQEAWLEKIEMKLQGQLGGAYEE